MKMMARVVCFTIGVLALSLFIRVHVQAHPGSGIVVDRNGIVYFVDTGGGVRKIDRSGRLTRHEGPAYHWMAIDLDGGLKGATMPSFGAGDAVVTLVGTNPSILLSSDFPIVVGRDGNLYYPWLAPQGSGDRLKVFRLAKSGETSVLVTLPDSADGARLRWLNGLAAGPDSSIYFTENRAVRKINKEGRIATVAENISLTGCISIPGMENRLGACLRGLDVDSSGNVFVAASGCGSVLKITPDGKVTTMLRTTSPWSPTSVALSGNDLYVLEYLHTPGDDRRMWLPRVRKLSADGSVATVAEIRNR